MQCRGPSTPPRSPSPSSGSFVIGQDDRAKGYRPWRNLMKSWEVWTVSTATADAKTRTQRNEPKNLISSLPLYFLSVATRKMHANNFIKLSQILIAPICYRKYFCFCYCFRLLFARISLISRLRQCVNTDAALTKSPSPKGEQATWLVSTLPKNLRFITPSTG